MNESQKQVINLNTDTNQHRCMDKKKNETFYNMQISKLFSALDFELQSCTYLLVYLAFIYIS